MNQYDMKGRHAVITGGATGLGYAIAERVLASGGSVTIWDRDEAGMAKAVASLKYPGLVHSVQVDVSQHVDAVVNCAGITGPNTQVWNYPVDAWQQVMDVNINGVFYCCREWAPHLKDRPAGRIVNIASVAGKDGNPNASAYSASKAAVMAITKSLGKELANSSVRVNCVTPAAVKTAIFDQMTPEHIQFMLSKIPMGRFGMPEEVAAMVTWLMTEDCSFSTGAVFDLSGGRSTY